MSLEGDLTYKRGVLKAQGTFKPAWCSSQGRMHLTLWVKVAGQWVPLKRGLVTKLFPQSDDGTRIAQTVKTGTGHYKAKIWVTGSIADPRPVEVELQIA